MGCPSYAPLDHIELHGDEQLTFGEGQRILIGICIDGQVIEAIGEGWKINEILKPFSLCVRPNRKLRGSIFSQFSQLALYDEDNN